MRQGREKDRRKDEEQPLSPRGDDRPPHRLERGEEQDSTKIRRKYPVDSQGDFLYPEDAATDLAENEEFSYLETFKRNLSRYS